MRSARLETCGRVSQAWSETSDTGLEGATRRQNAFNSDSIMPNSVVVPIGTIETIGGPISQPKIQAVAWARAVAACSRADDARIARDAMNAEQENRAGNASIISYSSPPAQAAATRTGTPVRIRLAVASHRATAFVSTISIGVSRVRRSKGSVSRSRSSAIAPPARTGTKKTRKSTSRQRVTMKMARPNTIIRCGAPWPVFAWETMYATSNVTRPSTTAM